MLRFAVSQLIASSRFQSLILKDNPNYQTNISISASPDTIGRRGSREICVVVVSCVITLGDFGNTPCNDFEFSSNRLLMVSDTNQVPDRATLLVACWAIDLSIKNRTDKKVNRVHFSQTDNCLDDHEMRKQKFRRHQPSKC
jgi:hypothetical protein